jgi:NADH-quinone oxidoreductase subunit F
VAAAGSSLGTRALQCFDATVCVVRAVGGSAADVDLLVDLCDNILGRSFCGLGDGATAPVTSSVALFRKEYLDHIELGRCPFDRTRSVL